MLRELDAAPNPPLLGWRLLLASPLSPTVHPVLAQLRRPGVVRQRSRSPAQAGLAAVLPKIGLNGNVGIWHETYTIRAGDYEAIYVNMPRDRVGQGRGDARPGLKLHVDGSGSGAEARIRRVIERP